MNKSHKSKAVSGTSRKIYLASSWRNSNQPRAVEMLRQAGHEVYDFRNPPKGSPGFAWTPIGQDWLSWTPERFVRKLGHPIARLGYSFDKAGLDWADTCVLLLPCGRSAHLEAGYAIGRGKPTLIVLDEDQFEPELMYLLADKVVAGIEEMLPALDDLPPPLEDTLAARVKELELELAAANCLDAEASIGAKELMEENRRLKAELAEARAAAVRWVTYDGTEATRPDRRCSEFNIGTVMLNSPLGRGTTMVAVMRPFAACRFPSDLDPEDIPDDFEPDEWVWQRVDKPEVVWLASIGDRWACLPTPPAHFEEVKE